MSSEPRSPYPRSETDAEGRRFNGLDRVMFGLALLLGLVVFGALGASVALRPLAF